MRTKADLIEANELTPDVAEDRVTEGVRASAQVMRLTEQLRGLATCHNEFTPARAVGPLLKIKQAAQYLAIGERQLQYEVARNNISCVRFGKNCIRFAQNDLDEYVDQHRSSSQAAGGN